MADKEEKKTTGPNRFHVGIDAGSVSLNCIVINQKQEIIFEAPYGRHIGKVDEGVLALIQGLYDRFGEERIGSISFTGSHGKKLSEVKHRHLIFFPFSCIDFLGQHIKI